MVEKFEDIELLNEEDIEIDFDIDEITKDINYTFENLDKFLKDIVQEDYILEQVNQLRTINYNKLSFSKREQALANIHTYIVSAFSGVISSSIYFANEGIQDSSGIELQAGKLYVNSDFFKRKNVGFRILFNYLYKIREALIFSEIANVFYLGIDPNELTGLAKDYYSNLSESILSGAWSNEIPKNSENYGAQPIVLDNQVFVFETIFEYLKYFYKKENVIDEEMSDALNQYINFYDELEGLLEKRKEIVKKNMERLEKIDKEREDLQEYLDLVASDLTKVDDDTFYQLFNSAYYINLKTESDEFFFKRLENLANGLFQRTFRNFDLSKFDYPVYKLEDFSETDSLILKKIYKDTIISQEMYLISDVFVEVISDISELAIDNLLFEFKDEEEKKNCYLMKEWMNYKKEDKSEETLNIKNDGLNIINVKINEVLANIENKINNAIKKSKFYPHGLSAIRTENRDALYDYHEFKNGLTKEEVTTKITNKVNQDLLKRRG